MGDTLAYAQRVDLVDMVPRGELASTDYALANPDREYLVLQPDRSAAPFSVALEPGTYAVEWFDVDTHAAAPAGEATADRATTLSFAAPFDGPAVLYLKRTR
jgi:hypothetical protein